MKKVNISSVLLTLLMHSTAFGMQITKARTVKPKIQRQFQITPSARGGLYMFELIDELNNPQSPLYKVVQGHLDLKKAELEVKKAEVELKKIEVECQILSAGSLGNDRNKLLKRLESVNTKE